MVINIATIVGGNNLCGLAGNIDNWCKSKGTRRIVIAGDGDRLINVAAFDGRRANAEPGVRTTKPYL